MNVLKKIEGSFSNRQMPKLFLVSEQLAAHEYDDVAAFWGRPWSTITCEQLEEHFEAIYWLSPEAFCYYLPGILSCCVKENKPSIMVVNSLIGMLDRSPDPDSWDDFFLARWPRLSVQECEAVQEWILWLSSLKNGTFSDDSLGRSFDTLELLKRNAKKGSATSNKPPQ